ncbi:MAG: hypothetical protein RR859_07330, partial [Ruthenibacterium sp.]
MKRHCRAWDGERRGDESYVGTARSDEGVAPYRTDLRFADIPQHCEPPWFRPAGRGGPLPAEQRHLSGYSYGD